MSAPARIDNGGQRRDIPNVVILLARCSRFGTTSFGIRIEERDRGQWYGTWAFIVEPGVAAREGYGARTIDGAFNLDESYPGCPQCEQRSLVVCRCGKVTCWNPTSRQSTCSWCGWEGAVEGSATRLMVGSDR